MEGDDDLMLSLSLSIGHRQVKLNCMLTSTERTEQLASSSARGELPVLPMLRGIDVNRVSATERGSEEAGTSSPNSTLSSVSGKRGHAVTIGGGGGGEMISDEEDGEGSRKKLRLSKDQSVVLEESFKEHNTLNPKQKQVLSRQLNLRPRQVEVWFQNRRARTKLKQTEVDCEFLKRCCQNLTDENGRLQKEVAELRAIKLSPPFYMHMNQHTNLTMCPSCERVAPSNKVAVPMSANVDHLYVQHSHNQQRSFAVAGNGNSTMPSPWAHLRATSASFPTPIGADRMNA